MATASQGVEFRRWDSATGSWEQVSEITSIVGPNMTRTTLDTTTLDTTGGYMTFIGGLRDPGGLTLGMNFTRDAYETMLTDFEDDDNTTIEFEGLVTELPLNMSSNILITCDITIKASGQITIESGSGPSAGA